MGSPQMFTFINVFFFFFYDRLIILLVTNRRWNFYHNFPLPSWFVACVSGTHRLTLCTRPYGHWIEKWKVNWRKILRWFCACGPTFLICNLFCAKKTMMLWIDWFHTWDSDPIHLYGFIYFLIAFLITCIFIYWESLWGGTFGESSHWTFKCCSHSICCSPQ